MATHVRGRYSSSCWTSLLPAVSKGTGTRCDVLWRRDFCLRGSATRPAVAPAEASRVSP